MDYGTSNTTITPRLTNISDDYLPKDEKDLPESSRKTVTIHEPSDTRTSTGAARETEPLLFSHKTEQEHQIN